MVTKCFAKFAAATVLLVAGYLSQTSSCVAQDLPVTHYEVTYLAVVFQGKFGPPLTFRGPATDKFSQAYLGACPSNTHEDTISITSWGPKKIKITLSHNQWTFTLQGGPGHVGVVGCDVVHDYFDVTWIVDIDEWKVFSNFGSVARL